jgi:hypothetical protein
MDSGQGAAGRPLSCGQVGSRCGGGQQRERDVVEAHVVGYGLQGGAGAWAAEQAEALQVPVRPIEAVPLAATRLWMDRSGREQPTRCAAVGQVAGSTGVSRSAKMEVVLAVVVMATATRNRVLYKIMLVPLREYPFFLVQFTTFGYPSSLLAYQFLPSTIVDRPRCFESRLLLAAACDREEELHQLCVKIP